MTLAPEPAGDAGPRWVMARAEEELVARYDGLDDSELGLTPVMFDPPTGAFLVARDDARPDPVGGVGLRTIGGDAGARRRGEATLGRSLEPRPRCRASAHGGAGGGSP